MPFTSARAASATASELFTKSDQFLVLTYWLQDAKAQYLGFHHMVKKRWKISEHFKECMIQGSCEAIKSLPGVINLGKSMDARKAHSTLSTRNGQ
ncbi:hypothetical protein V6N12_046403 [Hibiscus sabdariffa]|uniref:Uncharacterized protein n=1 Tax=Hibiscus sabdariffa TaxID=183260 RepID=A0ABR2DJQ1_9ROSI